MIKDSREKSSWKIDMRCPNQVSYGIVSMKNGAIGVLGEVDIVVCNAAVLTFALFNDLTVEQLRQSLEINVLGTINVSSFGHE